MDIVKKDNSVNALEKTVELMSNPEFRELFDKYFNNLTDIQSILLFMKTYEYLEKLYSKQKGSDEKPSKQFMVVGIRKLLTESTSRRLLVDSTMQFMADYGKFEDIIEKNLNVINNSPEDSHFIDGVLRLTQDKS